VNLLERDCMNIGYIYIYLEKNNLPNAGWIAGNA